MSGIELLDGERRERDGQMDRQRGFSHAALLTNE